MHVSADRRLREWPSLKDDRRLLFRERGSVLAGARIHGRESEPFATIRSRRQEDSRCRDAEKAVVRATLIISLIWGKRLAAETGLPEEELHVGLEVPDVTPNKPAARGTTGAFLIKLRGGRGGSKEVLAAFAVAALRSMRMAFLQASCAQKPRFPGIADGAPLQALKVISEAAIATSALRIMSYLLRSRLDRRRTPRLRRRESPILGWTWFDSVKVRLRFFPHSKRPFLRRQV